MNLKLLKEVLSWQAESRNTAQQQAIMDNVRNLLGAKVNVTFDAYGNMYMVKGTAEVYPCVVAHVDQVHTYCLNYNVLQSEDVLLAYDPVAGKQVGVGGDDKCGIYLVIQMLKKYPAMKAVLFKDEEIGCLGSGKANIEFFTDCAFILQGDRKHNTNDAINHTNGVSTTSTEFDDAAAEVLKANGYFLSRGTSTDIGELVYRDVGCCAMNIACGYYNAHSSTEIVRISKLEQCENFFYAMIDTLAHQRWEHIAKKYVNTYFGGTGGHKSTKNQRWDTATGKWVNDFAPLPSQFGKKCTMCNGVTAYDSTHGDQYCASCGLFARDIQYWEEQLKLAAQ